MIPHDLVGRKSEFAFGKFSGTAVVLEEVLKPHGIEPSKDQLRKIVLEVKDMQEKREAEKAKMKEVFVNNYYNTIRRMALTMEEVLEVANKIMKE
jgi:isopropylmalate/homocitrate/citramalate synthase